MTRGLMTFRRYLRPLGQVAGERLLSVWKTSDPIPVELLLSWLSVSAGLAFLDPTFDTLRSTPSWAGLLALHVPEDAWGLLFLGIGGVRFGAAVTGDRRWRLGAAWAGLVVWSFLFASFLFAAVAAPGASRMTVLWHFGFAGSAYWTCRRLGSGGHV